MLPRRSYLDFQIEGVLSRYDLWMAKSLDSGSARAMSERG